MKYICELTIIMAISLAGELLHDLLPLPVPASVYGLLIMFAGLASGVIPLKSVETTGRLLTRIMPVFFIPVTVELMDLWEVIGPMLPQLIALVVVSTICVQAASGWSAQAMIRRKKR